MNNVIVNKAKNILSEYTKFEVSKMKMDTDLKDELDLNSVDVMEIAIQFEDEFDIEIPEKKLLKLHNIGDIINLIEELID